MQNVYYIDGDFVTSDDARLPVADLAVLRGYGVFDFMRTYGGQPFHLDAHLDRLLRSAEQIDLDVPWTHAELRAIVEATVERNDHAESNVRIVLTGGATDDFITPLNQPRLMVLVTPAALPPAHYYTDGVKIITERTERYLPGAKTLNYIPAIRALKRARAADAIEAIYVDAQGRASEGTTTNLFAFFGDTLVTAGEGVLPGITRSVVLQLAADIFSVQQRDLPLSELLTADEVFITSSNKQVMPVVQIDATRIADGVPGVRTRRLMQRFTETVADAVVRE
ncbi:MAG: aminotransferase class IV [Armatimonadetes bacterium]|nr:aminotransferase class IV [Anaerolineae bacterium]